MNAIVIFTIADSDTRAYLKEFFPEENLTGNEWQFKVYEFRNVAAEVATKFLFINDRVSESSFLSADKENIAKIIDGIENVYVVFHEEKKFTEILKNGWSIKDHHNKDGWTYNILVNISLSIQDYSKCSDLIKDFINKFPNPDLETEIANKKNAAVEEFKKKLKKQIQTSKFTNPSNVPNLKKLIIWDEEAKAMLNGFSQTDDVVIKTENEWEQANFDFKSIKVIIILVELKWKNKHLQDFYGVDVAKYLRKNDISAPIIFTSATSRKEITSKLDRKIVNAVSIGHHFIKLNDLHQNYEGTLNKMRPLTSLELRDVQLFSCDPEFIVMEKFHHIGGLVDKFQTKRLHADEVKREMERCIVEMYDTYKQSGDEQVSEFRDRYSNVTLSNIDTALQYIKNIGFTLINKYTEKESYSSDNKKRKWKVLLLDDELTEDSRLIKSLKKNVDVICTKNAEEAMNALAGDNDLRGKISVIITDFRLNSMINGVTVQQPIQGYTFLQKIGERFQSKLISAVIYSGMPRRFLMESLKGFRMRCEPYSKTDFKASDEKSITFLSERIKEIGDSNYEALNALPLNNKGWEKHLHEWYMKFRNLPDYETRERNICELCNEWIAEIKYDIFPHTPMIPGDSFVQRKNEFEEDALKRFEHYYTTRRLALFLYLYFISKRVPRDQITVKIADILMPVGKSRRESAIKGFFSQTLGVSIFDFPFGATIEDLNWLEYEVGIPVLDGYRKFRHKMSVTEEKISEFILTEPNIKAALKNENFAIKKGKEFINFETTKCFPYFFDKEDIRFTLEWLNEQKGLLEKEKKGESLRILISEIKELWKF